MFLSKPQSIPIFVANPDSYGRLGHQSMRILTSLLLAELYNGFFIPLKYSYFSAHHNNNIDFGSSSRAYTGSQNGSISYTELAGKELDQHGNNKYDLLNMEDINECFSSIDNCLKFGNSKYQLIRLPFDQHPGRLLSIGKRISSKELEGIFHFRSCNLTASTSFGWPYIAIHMRRGDVGPTSHPEWHIEDDVYLSIIRYILQCIDPQLRIVIVTQGFPSFAYYDDIQAFINSGRLSLVCGDDKRRSDNELISLKAIRNSFLVIGGLSSFSYLGAVIGKIPFISLVKPGSTPKEWPPSTYSLVYINSLDDVLQQIKLQLKRQVTRE